MIARAATIVSLCLALAAGALLLSARAKTGLKQADPAVLSSEAVDDTARRYEIVWMGAPYHPSAYEGTWIEKTLEERYRIELRPVYLGFGQKKELFFSGGEVPDISWEGDPITVQRLAYHGFIAQVPYELILEHAPDYVDLMNRTAPATWMFSYWEGANWGLPTLWLEGMHPPPGVWRLDWLRRVGIDKVPETLDEMHEALRRFVTDDPDGNGEQDTWGMIGIAEWWRMFPEVFGAFGVGAFTWMERDGRAVWGGTLPETKEALTVLREWYADGIIHPGFVSADAQIKERKFLNGQVGYIDSSAASIRVTFDPEEPTSTLSKVRQLSSPDAEIVAGHFPVGPHGDCGSWFWGGGGNILVFGAHTADEPGKVVRILEMLNDMITDEDLFVASKIGKRGLHWDYRDPSVGKASGVRFLEPYDLPHVAKREVIGTRLSGGAFYSPNGGDPDIYNRYLPPEEVEFVQERRSPEYLIRDILMKPDAVPSAADYLHDLRRYQETVFAEIIRGERRLDDFEGFVAEWFRRGGDRITEEANELLKARNRIYRIVGVPDAAPLETEAP